MNIEPCMFCGGEVYLGNDDTYEDGVTKCYTFCFDCLAEGPAKDTPEDAITAWNDIARIVREAREEKQDA